MGTPGKITNSLTFDQFCGEMDRLGEHGIPFLFVVDYKGERPCLWRLDEVPDGILYNFNGVGNCSEDEDQETALPVFRKMPVSYDAYLQAFSHAQKNIRRGESFLVNISAPTPIETNLSLKDIFYRSVARYKLLFEDQFVCFSPEPFVFVNGSRVATFPMKGTIDASLPDAAELVLQNRKEAAEHATIVDLMRNDISRVAGKVYVERYRYLESIRTTQKTLIQVSSEIRGELLPDYQRAYGSILAQMLPAGSVTGAPKPKTLQIIEEAEGYERGYYTGVMGCYDGVKFESAVMIRFIENTPEGLVFKSGGGITAMSDPRSEYQELVDKVYLPIPAFPEGN